VRISSVSAFHIRLPLASYFEISSGRIHEIDTVLVRLESGGEVGWGEAPPWAVPIYGPETAQTAFFMITEIFAPAVVGKTFPSPAALNDVLNQFKGNQFAKAALETSFWTFSAKAEGVPLFHKLGSQSKEISCGNSLGIRDTIGELLSDIAQSLEKGYRRIKIKVRPGWDIAVLEEVRNRFPDIDLQVDANSAYTIKDHDRLKEFDRYNLIQIEQPLGEHDLVYHSQLQKNLKTPICLDESIKTPEDARLASELGSCRIVNIKISRVGGLYNAVEIHNICKEHGIACWVGGMLESAVGETIAIHFATLPNICLPSDIFPSSRFYRDDITAKPLEMSTNGTFSPESVSCGDFEPDGHKLSKYTIQAKTVSR